MGLARVSDQEVEREARWVLRELEVSGGHLMKVSKRSYGFSSGKPVQIKTALAQEFHRRDWLRPRGTSPQSFALSDPGLFWLRRQAAGAEPFAAQHRILSQRVVKTAGGVEQTVTLNEGESPLGWLHNRGGIDIVQLEAGERLRRDFTIAGLTPRLAANLEMPVVDGSRGMRPEAEMSEMVLAAKQRFSLAMRAAGPVICDLLFDVCCHLIGLEPAESARAWPRRTAKVVLQIGLERLAAHYGLRAARQHAGVRGWRPEEENAA